MAEVAVDDRKLLKTMRWWDGFVVGLACPGFLLAGLAGSVDNLGPKWAAIIWFGSAIVGALQAYIYAEPAAMFPDKAGGLSMYAKEGWKRHFSLAGPIATFGYWFAWSSVLAIYGTIIGVLFLSRFDASRLPDLAKDLNVWHLGPIDVTWPRAIGLLCVLACYFFNVRGMRPAVWFSYVTGALLVIPLLALAIIPFLNGDITSHALGYSNINASLGVYGSGHGTLQVLAFATVWFWVIGWSTYGPEAPATFAPEFVDTKEDTRKAIISTGVLNAILSLVLPLTIVGVLGGGFIAQDFSYIAFLTTALDQTLGSFLGGVAVIGVCAGLLLSMNTATMDGSRALYGMAKDGLTLPWLAKLNSHHVPNRAMTVDMLMNVGLLFCFPSIFFVLVAGNIGYFIAHILALSGFLLLRRDRPAWPRPLRLGPIWIVIAVACMVINLVAVVVGTSYMEWTGYLYDPAGHTDGYFNRALLVALAVLVIAVAGYVVGQNKAGHGFRWRDRDEELPTDEAYELAGLQVPVR